MSKILPVAFYAQNDNEPWDEVSGAVQCCPTSNAMLAFYLKPERLKRSQVNGFSEPESYYKYLMDLAGFSVADRGNHDAHTEILCTYFQIDSVWRTDLTAKDIKQSIDRGFPVVCGLEYKVSGHVALVVGYTEAGLVIHDPYGIRSSSSNEYLS